MPAFQPDVQALTIRRRETFRRGWQVPADVSLPGTWAARGEIRNQLDPTGATQILDLTPTWDAATRTATVVIEATAATALPDSGYYNISIYDTSTPEVVHWLAQGVVQVIEGGVQP